MENILQSVGGDEATPLVPVSSYDPLDGDQGQSGDEPLGHLLRSSERGRGRRRKHPSYSNETTFDMESFVYSTNSFMAVVWPVALTMTLAALTTVYVSTESSIQEQKTGLSAYQVYDDDDADGDESNSEKLGKSVINALMIVLVLATATFGVVLLYKFRCMKCLVGYMMFSSTMLLGLMGGLVVYTALDKWQVPCDVFTFYGGLYNFAVVGVISIFYKKGVPTIFTQAYLVMTSVIMAWQLSRFEEWTGWSLLVCLALYDLCAVLTPCGPLKALVRLMQEYQEPMPGLLYEAELPTDGARANASSSISAVRMRRQEPEEEGLPLAREVSRHGGKEGTSDDDGADDDSVDGGSNGRSGEDSRQGGARNERQQGEGGGGGGGGGVGGTGGGGGRGYEDGDKDGGDDDDERDEKSIKLGLGDFVFYSVLVSKAALYGFAPCVASFLVIIAGLGMTLVLLSIYKMALPALPISIGLGVVFYLLTRFSLQPYLEALAASPIYI